MATDKLILPSDPSPAGRYEATRSKTEDAITKHFPRIITEPARTITFRGIYGSFRVPGSAATPQNLLTISNASGSTVLVGLRELRVWTMPTVATITVVPPILSLYRITSVPSGGTAATKTSLDSREAASNASVTIRGPASADGTATAITATAAGQRLSAEYAAHQYALGLLHPIATDVLAAIPVEYPLIMAAGDSYLLQLTTAAAADNVATRHFVVECMWEEFSEF